MTIKKIKVSDLPAADTLTGNELLSVSQKGKSVKVPFSKIVESAGGGVPDSSINVTLDGDGNVLSTGMSGFMEVPFDCTIDKITLLADTVGSVVIDIWKCNFTQFDGGVTHPVIADSITSTTKPTIDHDIKYQNTDLTNWDKSLNKDDILGYNVNSVTDIKKVTISLHVVKG